MQIRSPCVIRFSNRRRKKNIVKDLNEKVIANNYKIGTGFLTTAGVLKVLCEQGYVDTAYRMLENTEQPGWLYAVTKGAKSIWENWYGKDSNNVPRDSMNHYAPGSVVAWLFNTVAGINPLRPGYEEISISPVPGGTLRWAEAETKTCRGWVKSSWHWEGNKFVLKIQVPEKQRYVCQIKISTG